MRWVERNHRIGMRKRCSRMIGKVKSGRREQKIKNERGMGETKESKR